MKKAWFILQCIGFGVILGLFSFYVFTFRWNETARLAIFGLIGYFWHDFWDVIEWQRKQIFNPKMLKEEED